MTAPQAALLMFGADPAFSTVIQLAHFNGANASTTLTNNSGISGVNTIIAGSLDTISTTQSVFGGASLRRSTGTITTSAAEIGPNSYSQFTTNDFTIEFRFRPDTVGLLNIFDMRDNAAGNVAAATIYTKANGTLVYFVSNTDRITSAAGVIANTTWAAIAVSRVSGTTRMFVDGTQVGSNFTDGINYSATARQSIPSYTSGQTNAYYDELRISNGRYGTGAGRYAANYTIATGPFPNS